MSSHHNQQAAVLWNDSWGEIDHMNLGDVPAITVTSENHIVVFSRGPQPVIILDENGELVRAFGTGWFKRPHGCSFDGEFLLFTDDEGQRVVVATTDGEKIDVLEGRDQTDVTEYVPGYPHSVARSAPPFCYPTHAVRDSTSRVFVSDGYGNARVHVFEGSTLVDGWGAPGGGTGQFVIPHGLAFDKSGHVLVCDRENERVQIFDTAGNPEGIWEGMNCPNNLWWHESRWVVTELGRRIQGVGSSAQLVEHAIPARVSIRDESGSLVAGWRRIVDGVEDLYFAPHGLAVDLSGRIFVGEVRSAYGQGLAPAGSTLHLLVPEQWP